MSTGKEADRSITKSSALEQPVTAVDYFGGCPQCGCHDGYVNIGRQHWFVCNEHRTRWCIGENLFSSWREETDDDWAENSKRIRRYREVTPLSTNASLGPRRLQPIGFIDALEKVLDAYVPQERRAYASLPEAERPGHLCESLAIIHGWLNCIEDPVGWMRTQLGLQDVE